MTRHVADTRAPSDGTRLQALIAVARRSGEDGSHPAAQRLVRQPRHAAGGRRTQEFLRIARGRET
jgi:hypothetical protein